MHVRPVGISLDCADPARLAVFYRDLFAGAVVWQTDRSAGVRAGDWLLVAQSVDDYRPPEWPGTSIVHLDLTAGRGADDLAAGVARALELGARLADPQYDLRWTVLLDPAGHPFCLTTLFPEDD